MEDIKYKYFSELGHFPADTQIIIEDALVIYKELEHNDVENKKVLSLFLAVLNSQNEAEILFNRFGLDYYTLVGALNLDIKKNTKVDYSKVYYDDFRKMIKTLEDDRERHYTRNLTPIILSWNLLCQNHKVFEDMYKKFGTDYKEVRQTFKTQAELEEEREIMKFNIAANEPLDFSKEAEEMLWSYDFLSVVKGQNVKVDSQIIKKIFVSLLEPSKSALIVGKSGTGKTTTIKALAHYLQTDASPQALRDKVIVSLDIPKLISGCRYVGMFEEKITSALDTLTEMDNVILFVDDLQMAFNAGRSVQNSNDLSNVLKTYLDDDKIKMLGAINENFYNEPFFQNSVLKRNFEIVKINEPADNELVNICFEAIYNLSNRFGISFLDDDLRLLVVKELVKLTNDKNRVYNDKSYNPDLIVSILTRAFALATLYEKETVTLDEIIEAISDNEKIYPLASQKSIKRLSQLRPVKANTKIIKFKR